MSKARLYQLKPGMAHIGHKIFYDNKLHNVLFQTFVAEPHQVGVPNSGHELDYFQVFPRLFQ